MTNTSQGKLPHFKKRVGILHYTLPPAISGVEMVIRDHARLLSNNGFKVFLLGGSGKKFRSEINVQLARSFDPKNEKVLKIQEELKKEIVSEEFNKLKKNYKRILKNWIEGNKLEIVIIHNVLSRHYNLALTAAFIEIVEQKKDHVKFITWVHDNSFLDLGYTGISEKHKHIYPWNILAHFQNHVKYATISETRKKELLKLYGHHKEITAIPNGIDLNKMLPLPMQTRGVFQEIRSRNPDYVGIIPVRIVQRKNIEFVVEFARMAKEKLGVNFVFMITGALHQQNPAALKYYQDIKDKIKEYNLEKNFIFLYQYKLLSGEKFDIYKLNIRDLYIISDFLFLPSTGEGFGLPIIEAGLMRIPICVSDLSVFKEVGNGLIHTFNLNDPMELTIKNVLNYLKRSKRTIFHKLVLDKYSLETIVKERLIPFITS